MCLMSTIFICRVLYFPIPLLLNHHPSMICSFLPDACHTLGCPFQGHIIDIGHYSVWSFTAQVTDSGCISGWPSRSPDESTGMLLGGSPRCFAYVSPKDPGSEQASTLVNTVWEFDSELLPLQQEEFCCPGSSMLLTLCLLRVVNGDQGPPILTQQ